MSEEQSKDESSQPIELSESAPEIQHKVLGQSIQRISAYGGPLPQPSDLRSYDKIVPGAAERIISMAERQATHRQDLERTVVKGDSKRAFCGLFVGAIVAVCFLAGAVFLIYEGHDWAGSVLAGLDIGSLVYVFVIGSGSRRQERIKKSELVHDLTSSEDS